MITDFFPWLPDWGAGVTMKYRFDTVVNSSETGNDISRAPLYDKPKRTQTVKAFSPDYATRIDNFLRSMHADFFQVPVFTEPIMPVPGSGLSWGDSLKNQANVSVEFDTFWFWNLNTLASKVLVVDLTEYANSELHDLVGLFAGPTLRIGGAFVKDFILGKTAYYPVMQAYVNGYGDTLATPTLIDHDLVFEEYF